MEPCAVSIVDSVLLTQIRNSAIANSEQCYRKFGIRSAEFGVRKQFVLHDVGACPPRHLGRMVVYGIDVPNFFSFCYLFLFSKEKVDKITKELK